MRQLIRNPWLFHAAVALALLNCLHHPARGDEAPPATQPAQLIQPTTRPIASQAVVIPCEIRQWFTDLASPRAEVRDEAKLALMGLGRADLESLRQLVFDSRPLAPAQAAALHDIVTHVFLSEQSYATTVRAPFLGLRLPSSGLNGDRLGDIDGSILGVPVVERFPGFPAFRYLRDGDILLSISDRDPPDGTEQESPLRFEMRNPSDVSNAIGQFRTGQSIRVEILRLGRPIVITIPLESIRPDEQTDQLLAEREHAAESYWEQNFAALVMPEAS